MLFLGAAHQCDLFEHLLTRLRSGSASRSLSGRCAAGCGIESQLSAANLNAGCASESKPFKLCPNCSIQNHSGKENHEIICLSEILWIFHCIIDTGG